MMDRFDDFDWSGTSAAEAPAPAAPPPPPDEAPPPPSTPQTQGRRGEEPTAERDWYGQPAERQWYGRKNVYKRPKRVAGPIDKFDDFDWGQGAPRTGEPAYNPDDDWAITRGFKGAEQGGRRAMEAAVDMARIAALPPDQQRVEMLKRANAPRDVSEVELQAPAFTDIGGIGDFFTWLGESSGGMLGSMVAAAEYGGLPGAAVGAGVGAGVGATGAGVGALPGAVGGGVAGFTYGSLAAFAGMGVGGMFDDLLHDEGVQRGLTDGSIDTDNLIKLTTAAGLTIGALDAVPAGRAVGRLGGKELAKAEIKKLIAGGIKKAALKGAGRGALEEGGTEALQGAISELGQAYQGGDINAVDRILSVINQGAAGAVGGAVPGVAGGVVEYQKAANDPSTGAKPAPPAGVGAPAPVVPPTPVGGPTASTPPQPAGKVPAGGATVSIVPTGGIPPDITAATTPSSSAKSQQVGTGDKDIDLTLGVGTQAPPVHQPADPNISVAEGLPDYGEPRPPEVPPAPPPGAPAPAAPTPVAPAPVAPAPVAPAPVAPAEELQPEPAEEAPLEIPAEPIAEPALVEKSKPIPVVVEEPVSSKLTPPPETKVERVKRIAAERQTAKEAKAAEKEQAEKDKGIISYARELKMELPADVQEAKDTLDQFRDKPDTYRKYYNAMSIQLRRYIGDEWHPDYVPAEERQPETGPIRQPARPWKRPEPKPGKKEPQIRKRSRRAPVELEKVTAEPAPTVKSRARGRKVHVTPEIYGRMTEQARAKLVGSEVRHGKTRKRVGKVTGTVEHREPPPPAPPVKPVEPITIQGKAYTSAEQIDADIRKLQTKVDVENKKLRAEAEARRAEDKAKRIAIEARGEKWTPPRAPPPTPAARKLAGLKAFKETKSGGISLDYERLQPPKPAEPGPAETRYQVSGVKEAVTLDDLLNKYRVETIAEEERLPAGAVAAADKVDPIAAIAKRLAQHFKVKKARPVLLSSLGMEPEQIAALEKAGLAEDGSMDTDEFVRWERTLGGVAKPPPAVIGPPEARVFWRAKNRDKGTLYRGKPKKPRSLEDLHERWRTLNIITDPVLDEEMIPELEKKALGVAGRQAIGLLREAASGEADKPPAGVAADRLFVIRLSEIIGKLRSGAIDRTQAYKDLLHEQQFRVDRWAVLHKAEAMAEERIGKHKTTKAADAMRKEQQHTMRESARAQLEKDPKDRDKIRMRMNKHFDVLSENRGMVKSPTKQGDTARRQSVKAQAAIDDLKAQLVARAEQQDEAARQALITQSEKDAASLHAQEKERQKAITAYLQAQVKEGLLDPDMATMLADLENREHYDKYTKRIAREEITGPALRTAAGKVRMPEPRSTVEARLTKRIKAQDKPLIEARFVKGRKPLTAAQKEASAEFVEDLRPIVKWSEVGEPDAETAPKEIDDPKRQRIIGYKLPDWYLKQTRETVAEYLSLAKKGLGWKLRGKYQGTALPTRTNPYHNTVEENATIFMQQRLAVTGRPPNRRGYEESLARFMKQRTEEVGRPLTKRELLKGQRDYVREQKRIEKDYAKAQGAEAVAQKRGFGKIVIPTGLTKVERAKFVAKQRELGKVDLRGPERHLAGARKGITSDEENVKQKAHRTANIHDAIQVLHFLKTYSAIKQEMGRQDPVKDIDYLSKLEQERRKLQDTIYSIVFDHAAMMRLGQEAATEADTKVAAAAEVGTMQRGKGYVEEALTVGQEESAREMMEEDIEAAEAGLRASAEEWQKTKALEQKMAQARLLSTKFSVVTVEGKKYLLEHPTTLPEGPLSREALEGRPVGVPVRSLSGRQALDEWANKGQIKGWQRWVRGALIRSLRQLVGDIDVHVVDGIYANNKAGAFVPGPNPQILINREALGRPLLLADTIIHEMAHAATNYALHNNLRGTRDIVQALMRQLKTQLGGDLSDQSVEIQNAFTNADEFLAAFADHAPFQDMLASLSPDRATRAQIRALGRGRIMPTYWDQMVAMVENAIGFFTPAGHGGSYMSQVLKIYPHAAMSLTEQARHFREQGGSMPDVNETLEFPLSLQGVRNIVQKAFDSGTGQTLRKGLPSEELRRVVAEKYFGGDFNNPTKPLFDALMHHPNLVTDQMADGDIMDENIIAWVNEDRTTREPIVQAMYKTITDSVVEGVDVTRDIAANKWIWDDALHPLKSGLARAKPTVSHVRDSGKRAAHAQGRAEWLAYPQQLRTLMSDRLKIMTDQMAKYERGFTENWVKMLVEDSSHPMDLTAIGMTQAQAVQEILDGKISKPLKTALGDNYRTIKSMGRMTRQGRLYAPLFRAGQYFISGRRDIPLPAATRGTVHVDQQKLIDKKVFEFVFSDEQDMIDYTETIGASGDERVAANPYRETVPGTNKAGKPINKPTGNWRVPMQDRFMSMHDDFNELVAEKDRLMASGEYKHISDPLMLDQRTSLSGAMPLKLQKMLDNIDSNAGASAAEKSLMKSMVTTMFVQTQQGNRITKKLLKRKGIHGYDTGYEDMRRAFRTNNEMMSRAIVALTRLPAIKEATSYTNKYVRALSRRDAGAAALSALTPADQAYITRNMGKIDNATAANLQSDIKTVTDRIESSMLPRGGTIVGEDTKRAFMTSVTLAYLAGPSYTALQMLSLPMFSWPRMAAEMARKGGWASAGVRATKLLYEAGTEVGFLGVWQSGAIETLMEMGEVGKGFAPRKDWMKHARTVRRSKEYLPDLYARLRANAVAYADDKVDMLEELRLAGGIGQAGINQQNLQEDLLGPGMKNKVLRGIKASGKVFQAFQEAAEINNRAVPAIAYFNHFIAEGDSVAQAKAKAINKVQSEQVNYAKENWPSWVSTPGLAAAFMFKKFGAQQALNYYDSMMRAVIGADKETRRAAQVHLASSMLVMVALGGFVGNPLWEPIRMLNYLLSIIGLNFMSADWNEAKTNGEKMLANVVGDRLAEDVMYGATREAGIDLSSRIAMDSVTFFKQPEEMSEEGWTQIIGQTVGGAPWTLGVQTVSGLKGLTDKMWSEPSTTTVSQDLAKLPFPKMIKDIMKAADLVENGPTTTSGVSTGEPLGVGGAILQSLGFRSRTQSRPFEQGSAAQHRIKENIKERRQKVMTMLLNSGMGGSNMRQLRDWNRSHRAREERITMKNLHDARRRRRKVELDIRRKNLEAA